MDRRNTGLQRMGKITTEAMVAERPKKEAAHAPMPGGMGEMDY